MSLIPEEQLKSQLNFNFAPMIDFLFLMLAFFATLAVSRATLYDAKLDLVKVRTEAQPNLIQQHDECSHVNLTITSQGQYKWITEINDYPMETIANIQQEILHQYRLGILPQDKKKY